MSRKIHVLGTGNLGYFIAHTLRSASANVTLHFHRLRQADTFNAVYGITIVSPSGTPVFRDGFGYEMKDIRMRRAVPYIPNILDAQRRKEYVPAIAADKMRPLPEEANIPPRLEGGGLFKDSDIKVLIVAKKAGEAIRALKTVQHRLKRNSTVVLLHNGMGVLARVKDFWEPHERPNILEGFSTHGLSMRDEFTIDHWGNGAIHLTIAPRQDESDIFAYQGLREGQLPAVIDSGRVNSDIRLESLTHAEKNRSLVFIIQQLVQNKVLNCTLRAYDPHFYLIQLRRTVIQSILQTLGALQRCTNGELIQNRVNHSIIGKLLTELCPVLRCDPVVSSSSEYLNHFSFSGLYEQVRHMALAAPTHMNAILQDVAERREIELGYHSGYLLSLASKRKMEMPTWRAFHELVKAQASLEQTRYNQFAPISKDGKILGPQEWIYNVTESYWKMDHLVEIGEARKPHAFEVMEKEVTEQMRPPPDVVESSAVSVVDKESVTTEDNAFRHDSPINNVETREHAQETTSLSSSERLSQRLRWTTTDESTSMRRQRALFGIRELGFSNIMKQRQTAVRKSKADRQQHDGKERSTSDESPAQRNDHKDDNAI
jgi:2-dehydropantoate 2-reductase